MGKKPVIPDLDVGKPHYPTVEQRWRTLLVEGFRGCGKCGGWVRREYDELACLNCGSVVYDSVPLPFKQERPAKRPLVEHSQSIA